MQKQDNPANDDLKALVDLDKQITQLSRERARVEFSLRSGMIESGNTELDLDLGKVKVVKKGGKGRKSEVSDEETAIKHRLAAETAEMTDQNAERLYALQTQAIAIQAEINKLQSNVWTKELRGQLKAAEENRLATEVTPENATSFRLSVKLKEQQKPLDEVDAETADKLLTEGAECKQICGKKITPAKINGFLDDFFTLKYGLKSLDEAWEDYKNNFVFLARQKQNKV